MSREALEALRGRYLDAKPFRHATYGSRPWSLAAADGGRLASWRSSDGRIAAYEVWLYRLKRDAEAGRVSVLAEIERQLAEGRTDA